MPNTIFNVPEAQGAERVQFETTAATAQAEAPTGPLAREVEANADHAKEVAHDAASAAQTKGPALTGEAPSAVNQLQQQAKETTDAAVAEGQHDVETAKATGVGYVDQAKALASSAIAAAQSYLPTGLGGSQSQQPSSTDTTTASHVTSSIQAGATTTLDNTKEYLASAHRTSMAAAQLHLHRVKDAAQNAIRQGTQGSTPASSTGIPATSAPLESRQHSSDDPYPSTSGPVDGGNETRLASL